jgi:hypothetical protein
MRSWTGRPTIILTTAIGLLALALGLYLSLQALGAEVEAAFARPDVDFIIPEDFDTMSCPGVLGQDETGTVSVTFTNRSDKATTYSHHIEVRQRPRDEASAGSVSVTGPVPTTAAEWDSDTYETTGTIPAHGVEKISWQVRVIEKQGQALIVNLQAETDASVYLGSCSVALMPVPGIPGKAATLFVLLGIPASVGLLIYARRPPRCLTIVGIVIVGLLWLLMAWLLLG